MADFIVRKRRDFVFAIDTAPEQTFTLPDINSFGFEDAKLLTQISEEKDIVNKGKLIEEFLLKFAPALKDMGLSGMEYFEIFNAYGLAMGRNKLGELQASQVS